MRVGAGSGKLGALEGRAGQVSSAFLEGISARAVHAPVKVMMPDSTVSDQSTFDPARVSAYMSSVLGRLAGWESDGVRETREEDVRRAFAKFSRTDGEYTLSCHMSVQYHALLHYRPDARVGRARRELAGVVDSLRSVEGGVAEQADSVVERKLREAGYGGLDEQGIFEALFNDDELRGRISEQVGGSQEYRAMARRRQELVDELDSLLLETYQTSCVLIDEARLVTGEEGLLFAADLERTRGGAREGHFAQAEIPDRVVGWIDSSLAGLQGAMVAVNREADAEEGLRGRYEPPDLA